MRPRDSSVACLVALALVACAGTSAATLAERAAVDREHRVEVAEVEHVALGLDVAPVVAGAVALEPVPAAVVGLGRPLPDAWADPPVQRQTAPPQVNALAAVVLDEASLAVLYEKDAHTIRAPASLTKIATAILVAEYGDLEDRVVSDVDARSMPRSTVMGVQPGDEFSLRDLLYGLMLPSGNDAALVIGRYLAGSEREFARQMTGLARRLGLTDTHFVNPHGLGGRAHYTTAYDLAVMSRYLMSFPELREVASARTYVAKGSRTIEMRTLNSLLMTYPGADGLKTGYIRSAGPTLAASATRDGHRLYVVILNSPTREADARALLDWAFASHVWPE